MLRSGVPPGQALVWGPSSFSHMSISLDRKPRNYVHAQRRMVSVNSVDDKEGTPPAASNVDGTPAPSFSAADPVQTVAWGGNLPSRRRATIGGLTGLGIILGGNFLGVTSFLLSLDGGKTAGSLRLDALVPVRGYKRCVDYQNGYEFLYPSSWLADQRLYRRYVERMERERALDPPSLRQPPRRIRSETPEPTAAFGPAGSTGEDNISVIVAPIRDGFALRSMGSPSEAAQRFLSTTVAPPGSNKVATLLAAGSRRDAVDGELYYTMEFTVEAPGKFKRHNVASYATRNGLLYTLNAQAAEERYTAALAEAFREAAASFRMTSSGASSADGFPQQL